jgi:hypothetical protein
LVLYNLAFRVAIKILTEIGSVLGPVFIHVRSRNLHLGKELFNGVQGGQALTAT